MITLVRLVIFSLIVGTVFVTYLLGLPGGFLLDDLPNLASLARFARFSDLATLGSLVFANPSGDLGRPIPMLSFALQAGAWPDFPERFKQVNIAIHAINGVLLYCCLDSIFKRRLMLAYWPQVTLALLFTLLWTLHPLHVSTVLYTVQRMTELSTSFMLGGLMLYLHGRHRWNAGRSAGIWQMAAGVLAGTTLAAFSKENGLLFPLAIAALETTIFAGERRGPAWSIWLLVCVLLPMMAVFGFIAWKFSIWIMPGYEIRHFDLVERLWTEARVLWSYLGAFVFPQSSNLGLFHDDYPISRGWLAPASTLFAVLGWVLTIISALVLRQRHPGVALAVFWFLGAHALESGPIPLEIYFEHRNYFPLIGVIIGLAWEAGALIQRSSSPPPLWGSGRWPLGVFLFGWLSYFVLLLVGETGLWARPDVQAEVWARERPDSRRAQAYLAQRLFQQGFVEAAGRRYGELESHDPGYLLFRHLAACRLGTGLAETDWKKGIERMRTMHFSRVAIEGMSQLVELTEHGLCRDESSSLIDATAAALMENPVFQSRRYHILVLQGRLRVVQKRYREADENFASALRLRGDVEVALLRVKVAFLAGDNVRALELLNQADRLDQSGRFGVRIYRSDIEDWRTAIEARPLKEQ